jgi:hypothetical protein
MLNEENELANDLIKIINYENFSKAGKMNPLFEDNEKIAF